MNIQVSDRVLTPNGIIGFVTNVTRGRSGLGERVRVEWRVEEEDRLEVEWFYEWQLVVQPELPFENPIYKWLEE